MSTASRSWFTRRTTWAPLLAPAFVRDFIRRPFDRLLPRSTCWTRSISTAGFAASSSAVRHRKPVAERTVARLPMRSCSVRLTLTIPTLSLSQRKAASTGRAPSVTTVRGAKHVCVCRRSDGVATLNRRSLQRASSRGLFRFLGSLETNWGTLKGRNRRISPVASRFGDRLRCPRIADIPMDRAEYVFVPQSRPPRSHLDPPSWCGKSPRLRS